MAAFEGNRAETATMVPVINAFKAAHQLTEVTVVADAGMISEANQVALQAAGLSFVLAADSVCPTWCGNRDKHPTGDPHGLLLTQRPDRREGPWHPGSGHPLPVPP